MSWNIFHFNTVSFDISWFQILIPIPIPEYRNLHFCNIKECCCGQLWVWHMICGQTCDGLYHFAFCLVNTQKSTISTLAVKLSASVIFTPRWTATNSFSNSFLNFHKFIFCKDLGGIVQGFPVVPSINRLQYYIWWCYSIIYDGVATIAGV